MPFLLDGNPTQGEISEAVNYLLSNFSQSVTADPSTGQVIGPGGDVQSYLYKYMFIKYADSYDGTVNFSDTPTNKGYYGLRNSDSSTESTNPADYVWTQVTGGFGTTKFLYYLTTGGRSIQFQVATAVPNPGWVVDGGSAIDLDFVTGASNSPANFVVIRTPNVSTAPTNAEVLSAIGRLPIAGDLCTINYNSGIASIVYKYTTGWAVFQKYITGDLIVADSIVGGNIKGGTITADKLSASYIQVGGAAGDVNSGVTTISGGKITAGSVTATQLSASYVVVGNSASDVNAGVTTINGGKITAGSVTATQLSASYITVGGAASDVNSGTTTINGGKITANSITVNEINNVATGQIIAGSFNYVSFTSSGTFTVPSYVYKLKVTVIGGGGGGGRTAYTSVGGGGGGGAGGGTIKILTVSPGDSFTVTIGSGGAGGTSGAGSAGSASSFVGGAYTITANGGSGGGAGVANGGTGGAGGTSSGGDINLQGGSGAYGTPQDSGSFNAGAGGSGGGAPFIGTSAGANTAASANSGGGGGGGGNANAARNGAAGGSGLVIVEY